MAVLAAGVGVAMTLAALPFASTLPPAIGLALYALAGALVIECAGRHHPHDRFGVGNGITLARAGGACVFAAVAVEPDLLVGAAAWGALAAAAGLLALDGLDGRAARGEGQVSAFGARFDLEVDALLILALAVLAAGLGKAGPWVIGLGLMRYLFVLAGLVAARPRCAAAALAPPPGRLRAAGGGPWPAPRPAVGAPAVRHAGRPRLRDAGRLLRDRRGLAAAASAVIAGLRSRAGLARSLIIYRARPWRAARLADFYRGIVEPGDLAFDIGAHVGNRTRALVAAGARVVALEPQALFHGFLARDLPPEVTLLRQAAGPVPGHGALAVSRLHPTVSSLAPGFAERMAAAPGFSRVRWDAAEPVEITTLDALIAVHGLPRFVKIDVEGFEADVLAGLSAAPPWVAFEYLPAALDTALACVARLSGLGAYAFNLVSGEARAFAAGWQPADLFRTTLAARARDNRPGDVYARLANA